jgi:hypothetical protein
MRYLLLICVWITPAIIAGVLGWRGIWGGTSAFADYLIPIPVAGGVMHVPSFVIACIVILNLKKYPESFARMMSLLALGIFLAVQTMQLDFDRLNDWFFTDYQPARSPFRFGQNPLYLFIATDALWVFAYALMLRIIPQWKQALWLVLVPIAIIAYNAMQYSLDDSQFTYGFMTHVKSHGNSVVMIHTSNNYDETLFREWLEGDTLVSRPWESQSMENLAVFFNRSMQDVKWRKTDNEENIVATFCMHEDDQSLTTHAGYVDCFVGRVTLRERLNQSFNTTQTGLGKEVDQWYAMAKLCEGIELPEEWSSNIELIDFCLGMKRRYPETFEKVTSRYGEDSEQHAFMQDNAHLIGIQDLL